MYGKPGSVGEKGRISDGYHLRGPIAKQIYSNSVLQMLKLHARCNKKLRDGISKHTFKTDAVTPPIEDALQKPETCVSDEIIDSKVS